MDKSKVPHDEPANPGATTRRHGAYYISDMIIFLVEDELFKVPRQNFITESEVFAGMFELPPPSGQGVEAALDGSDDDKPLRLEGIKKSDFEQLLRVMFPKASYPESLTLSEWTSVLELSTMWEFKTIRTSAISKMGSLKINPVDKILIAQKYGIYEWLMPVLSILVTRRKMLNLFEANRLGMEWVLKLTEVRERVYMEPDLWCYMCPNNEGFGKAQKALRQGDYSHIIRKVFDL